MKKICTLVLSILVGLTSALAFANVGAAINRQNARIYTETGLVSRAGLVAVAMRDCRAQAKSFSDCRPVNNGMGVCEHSDVTGSIYGALAAHRDADGWKGYLSCGASVDQAQELVSTICDHCALGDTIYDDPASN